ncbi:gas vesicle protein GvpO [Amycolatopsis sp. cmx-8-4]|uniref:gas vesicle protein GvpO n=1 Tax=Amycolatopsis sp. cmx-8-4 TaxID=2790947 RepID=UPI00397B7297
MTASRAIRAATEVFTAITGRQPEGVTGARPTADRGWSVLIDVVELERIPATTSVIGTYRVDVDSTGELVSYERIRRFTRGTTDL